MEPQRSKKARSLGVDSNLADKKPTLTPKNSSSRRPELGERHNSAPSVAHRRQSDSSKHTSESTKVSDSTRRSSKAGCRDDPSQSPTFSGHLQTSQSPDTSTFSVKASVKSIDQEANLLFSFIVVGNSKVGKSAFIRNAFDLRRPTTSVSTCKVSLGGASYRLQLIETPRESVEISNGKVLWPSLRESTPIDGVICLYDVSDRDSLEGLPQLLEATNSQGFVTCLVSCKNDIPLVDQEVSTTLSDRVKQQYPKIVTESTQSDHSDSAKRCLLRVLKEVLAVREEESQISGKSRINANVVTSFPPRTTSRDLSTSPSRSRSGSRTQSMQSKSRENLLTAPPSPVIESEDEEESYHYSTDEVLIPTRLAASKVPLRVNTAQVDPKPRQGIQTPVSTTGPCVSRRSSPPHRATAVPATPESIAGVSMARRESTDTTGSRIGRTFLNMDEESPPEDANDVDHVTSQLHTLELEDDTSSDGVSFGQLVDRLLALPASKSDQKFVPSFLCLYRVFATPVRLLTSIIERFVKMEASDLVVFTKAAELLRYLSILGQWTTLYPGDFADVQVREVATTFTTTIEKNKTYAPAARQISNNLQTLVPDEDDDWAFSEQAKSARSRSNTTSQKSTISAGSKDSKSQNRRRREIQDEDSDCENETPIRSTRHSATTSTASSLLKSSQVSSQTSDNLQNLVSAREHASKLRTVPQNYFTKNHWRQFMISTTEDLATEITRIDWTMYTAIRPRDFVRYVTAPTSQRVRYGQTDYIGMMTKHFNHVSLLVSGMILLRDKPKHRARILEKFMDLAWKVRKMNNYHALGAIVAALTGEEIVRLAHTQELIPQEHQKQFLRLKTLMSHQKSHTAYRMAWDNSPGERIPYLPRIQEDLTKAASANATMIGNRINWAKFEVMGETIIGIQRSQDQPYSFPDRTARGQEITKLILETKVLEGDEDCCDPKEELYERSKHVEPSLGAGEKKKFAWLAR